MLTMSKMRINRISETKRGRFALFVEDEFLFSVDAETLALHNICEGSSISNEELSLLHADSETRKAKDAALRYLSLRAYGERELFDKLVRKFDEQSCAAAVKKMCELDLLDDCTFATEKAKGMAQRGKSTSEIKRKLVALGVDAENIQEALQQCEADDSAAALKIVQTSYMRKLRAGERQKVMAALARRGFCHKDIQYAIEQAEEEILQEDGTDGQGWIEE